MADDRRGRDKQAHDAERRQRERELLEELERSDETEPPVDDTALDRLATDLSSLSFPATGEAVVEELGGVTVESPQGSYDIADLVPDTETVVFEDSAAVRLRVQRPTVAAAMKRIVEAAATVRRKPLDASQRSGYEKTLRALKNVAADDDDEGITVVTDWIIEQIEETDSLPGSRAVRRRGAEFCRANGYEVRSDEWLGV